MLVTFTAIFGGIDRAKELSEQEECGNKTQCAGPICSSRQSSSSHATLGLFPEGLASIIIT